MCNLDEWEGSESESENEEAIVCFMATKEKINGSNGEKVNMITLHMMIYYVHLKNYMKIWKINEKK